MSFKTNQDQQLTLTDSFVSLSPRTQRIVMNSWCKDFADIVFPAINEERFSVLYSSNKFSRPNTPVNFIIGALMLKEINGQNDDELFGSICCDVRYQYALHSTHLEEQPVSDRTFSRFRARLYEHELQTGEDLLEEEMLHLSDVYQNYMNLNSNVKRMDSLMISSRCKRMSRLEIIYTTTANAVRLLHRLGNEDLIPKDMLHYLEDDDHNRVIHYCKSDDVSSRLEKVIREAARLKEIMSDDTWQEFQEYQLLIRVLAEQGKTDGNETIIPKEKSGIPSASLQNPSDPDATYRSKAGKSNKGYVGNVIETVGEDGDSLITGASYKQNTHSDSAFCKEYLNSRPEDGEHEIMLADGAYSGHENQKLAESKNTELITTALTGKPVDPVFSGFVMNEEGTKVIACPMGYPPEKTTYYPKTGMCRALFKNDCCANCPNKEKCKGKPQRKNYAVHVSASMVQRAKYMAKLSTKEYITFARKRNAVEGIMSVLRRRYHIDDIPVLGYLRSRQFFWLKIGTYNFMKLVKHNKRVRSAQNLKIA